VLSATTTRWIIPSHIFLTRPHVPASSLPYRPCSISVRVSVRRPVCVDVCVRVSVDISFGRRRQIVFSRTRQPDL